MGDDAWAALEATHRPPAPLSQAILLQAGRLALPAFLADLARLEEALLLAGEARPAISPAPPQRSINPTLQAVETRWRGLVDRALGLHAPPPEPGEEVVLAWFCPVRSRVQARPATARDLLALKVVAEGLDPRAAAREAGCGAVVVEAALQEAVDDGLLLAPPSRLRRAPGAFPRGDERFLAATTFTLQWHVTQACDLHCLHCYDRSDRATLPVDQGLRILDDLYGFCRDRHVRGQVTFSGGNPLLYPGLLALYRASWERGFVTGLLGNPSPRSRVEELVAVAPPDFFQVSLEGLAEHNDRIRGPGHFERTLEFLDVLGDLEVYSMVMLTLTRDNLDQVIPLGEVLRGRTRVFHFNRLSPVGEGARLALPDPAAYRAFLGEYLAAAETNPVLGLKDNLFNPVLRAGGREVFGGCTGHGCGAAFNFLSLLPDGTVHACRKLPSPVGDLGRQSLAEIYDSPRAARYRQGSAGCRGCELRAACGGCLAVAQGL
ncbi:MAG: thio(seleno)oxazole modification radical SAM maturase SbtM, partial [Deferrisomatales bacterium]